MSDPGPEERRLVVAHHHPGRLRVRSRAFEWDEPLRQTTERWLAEQPGVRVVLSHAPTGSFLVVYDPSLADAGDLLTAIAARARLAISEPPGGDPPAQYVFGAMRALEDWMLELSGGRAGLGLVVPIALGIGSIASFWSSSHIRTPRWDNLLYWSVQFFRMLNEPPQPYPRRHASGG